MGAETGPGHDLTDRERQLLQGQKMEALARLAGGVAHDFNNLLAGILGNVVLARLVPPSAGGAIEPASAPLAQIEAIAQRGADLCKQLTGFAGKMDFPLERRDLNALARETVELVRLSIARNVALGLDLAPELPGALIDPGALHEALINLLSNGAEAFGTKEGEVRVRTGLASVLSPGKEGEGPRPGLLFLEVSDNGPGMGPEVLASLFEPFFTTKPTGRGLGLATVLGIVRGHGGTVEVRSEPGAGTTVRVLLPIPDEAPVPAAPKAGTEAPAPWRGEGLVLIVDDEDGVREVTKRIAQSFGFQVVGACDGQDALEKFDELARQGQSPCVVLLDLLMPKMDGAEALHALRTRSPDLAVVLMSGYSEPEMVARFADQGVVAFLPKPFRMAELQAVLRRACPVG